MRHLPMQKFHKGDHVQVGDMPTYMSHFTGNVEAIVIGSYRDQYGGSDTRSYTLHIKGQGEISWYEEEQLTLIDAGRLDLLEQWQAERDAELRQKSDLDWIFANGPEVVRNPHGASLQALADSKGMGSLWGLHGEGLTWHERAMTILATAAPFLVARDRAGWDALEPPPFSGEYVIR